MNLVIFIERKKILIFFLCFVIDMDFVELLVCFMN